MQKDPITRLEALSQKLMEVFLKEADPDIWPGAGMDFPDYTKEIRDGLYWSKRNAAATLALLARTGSLLDALAAGRQPKDSPPKDLYADDLDREIASAQEEAEKILGRVQEEHHAKHHTKHHTKPHAPYLERK